MWHSWHLSGREGGRGAIPCRMLHPQLLIRTSTIWSRWCFLSLLRWVVFPKGWGCVCLVEVVSGATCGGIVFSNHWCGFVSKKQLNRVVLLGNALTSSCRWQGCPSRSRLLLLDKIFSPSIHREYTHYCYFLKFIYENAEDNFKFVCLKGLNRWTFCSYSAVSHPSHCSPTDLLYSHPPQHDQWFPQDSSSNTVKQMSNEDVISSLLATGWG